MADYSKRLQKELEALKTDPVDGATAGPGGDDLFKWTAQINGPAGTPCKFRRHVRLFPSHWSLPTSCVYAEGKDGLGRCTEACTHPPGESLTATHQRCCLDIINCTDEGGIFSFAITFPPEYPFKAPKVKCETKIYHPNIPTLGTIGNNSEICERHLCGSSSPDGSIWFPVATWQPTCTIKSALRSLIWMIGNPDPCLLNALDPVSARQLTEDAAAFNAEARRQTKELEE